MTEDELDRIKKSFVRSSDECPMEVACLLTVMKYYGGQQDARTLAEWCKVDGKYTLMGMKQAAIRAGMEAEICLQNMEQLSTRKFPAILFAINDFEVPGYVVCYGIHEGRFIIWEPGFGPMQYWENQMKTLWIRGITLTLFPTHEFMQKTDFQLKWWELYPWSRKWKRRLNRWPPFPVRRSSGGLTGSVPCRTASPRSCTASMWGRRCAVWWTARATTRSTP